MHARIRSFAALLLSTGVLIGCASGPRTATRGASDLITRTELERFGGQSAFEAVQQLRPHFLRSRGPTSIQNASPNYAVVYIAGVRAGGLEALRRVRADEITQIRYIGAGDATTRYGTGHAGGVIEIDMNR